MKPYVPKKERARRKRKPDPVAEAQELWLTLTSRKWATLVLVPAHPECSALNLGYELVEACHTLLSRPIELLSTEGIELNTAGGWVSEAMQRRSDAGPGNPPTPGDRLATLNQYQRIVVIEPVVTNMLGLKVCQAADVVLIVVEKGVSDLDAARWTLEAIGRERVIGCAFVVPP